MATKEEKSALFKLICLSDQKIEETIKNEALSKFLVEIIAHVSDFSSRPLATNE